MLEGLEALLPIRPELRAHAAADEGPAHRRRLGLQLLQLEGIFRRQHVGNGGGELRDLHDRALQAAEHAGELDRLRARSEIAAKRARADHPRRKAADAGADPRIARKPAGKPVCLVVAGR